MTKLTDKILGRTMSITGLAGIVSGIGLITNDPKNIIGYSGTIASAGCLYFGINYLKKAYCNSEKVKKKETQK